MKQNVLFQGMPAPGNEKPWLTVVDLAWGEAGAPGFVPHSWVVGGSGLEVIRVPIYAPAALNPATQSARPPIITSLRQKSHPLREPGGH